MCSVFYAVIWYFTHNRWWHQIYESYQNEVIYLVHHLLT